MYIPYVHKYIIDAYTACMQTKYIYMYLDTLRIDIYIGCLKIYLIYSTTMLNVSCRHKHTRLQQPGFC